MEGQKVRQMKKHVRVITANGYYDLSERYSLDEISNRVDDVNDHHMLRLYDAENEPFYIRASKIESILVITESVAFFSRESQAMALE